MRSPTDPQDPHEEPGEIREAFGTPRARLDPPPGAFASLRRRAATRRRRRAVAAAAGVATCLAGITTAVALVAPGGADQTAAPPAATATATGTASPDGRSGEHASPTPESTRSTQEATTSASPEDPGATTGPGETPTCATAQLDLTAGRTDSAAGSIYVPLEFTNAGDASCAMLGYPGVSLVAESDGTQQVGAPATRGTERGEPVVLELAPGATATAELRITRAENYPTQTCDPAPTRGLRVYPPNQRASLFLPYENVTGCANEEVQLLSVTVVYADEG